MYQKNKNELLEWIQAIVVAIILALIIKTFVIETFLVDGESMLPTLHNADRLIVNKFIYHFKKPETGNIIVFKYPADPKSDFIKRVIAVEGQTVEIKNGKVFIDNEPLNEEYLNESTPGKFGPAKVPENHIFVLGDNRDNSRDSRFPDVGFVPLENVKGEAIFRIWPLSRFGLVK
ncbi:MAG: signal peptidase [Thermosediminibacterales bacterium]|nr:signal peptidase [Thermosediminibacterales bacterium]MDK2835887.1 signal peptidase [Thermosediminibacterales bacterium]